MSRDNLVTDAGRRAVASSAQTRTGPGGKNLGPTRVGQANPQSTIRSTGQQVRGPDKGAGSS